MEAVIPPKRNRREQHEYDKYLYRLRCLVENGFLALKCWRGIATRYAKTSEAFLAAEQAAVRGPRLRFFCVIFTSFIVAALGGIVNMGKGTGAALKRESNRDRIGLINGGW